MSRVAGDHVTLRVAVDSDDELRALYQAIKRAIGETRTEINRLSSLRSTGYGDPDVYHSQVWRLRASMTMLERLMMEATTDMALAGVDPW